MHSDEDLVDAFLDGDRDAFAVLIERYERPVRSVAIAILRDTESAQDVAQEAFMTAYEKLPSLGNRAAFGSWILTIARRAAYGFARDRARHRTLAAANEATAESTNGKLDERLDVLLQAVVRLPKHERVAVMLRYFDDYPVSEVAKSTGRSVGTVTKQLARARGRLKKWLGDSSNAR